MADFKLPHSERLRSFGAVRRLFQEGRGGFVYPFRYVLFAECDDCLSVEVLFSVPKKNHNKSLLHDCGKTANLDMALVYSSKEVVDYKTIENAVRKILSTVVEDL